MSIGQPALDELAGAGRWLEDIYPATPLQQGMLYHTLYDPESGVYFEQAHCALEGDLRPEAFRRAWQQIVQRHAVLRTHFAWEGLDNPVQIVQRQVELPWEELE